MLKILKKIFVLFIFWIFVFWNFLINSQAKILCWSVKGYALYKCRVDDICKKYYDGPKKTPTNFFNKDMEYDDSSLKNIDSMGRQVYRSFPYLKAEEYYKDKEFIKNLDTDNYASIPFYAWVATYKNNMDWIYRCAILYTRRKVLKDIEKLLKEDRSGEIRKAIKKNLKKKINKIEKLLSEESQKQLVWNCRNLDAWSVSKRDVLREVTYETCKFRTYMEYLKYYYNDNIKNLVKQEKKDWEKQKSIAYWSMKFSDLSDEILAKIEAQVRHSYLVFDKAFKEYSSYESNYYIHEMLELLKVEFIVLRIKLHNVLTPINQVVYKISNAMKLQ